MKVLVTGSKGQLGCELIKQLKEKRCVLGPVPIEFADCRVTGVDIEEIDITDESAVTGFIQSGGFDVIFNAAAFTNVDLCETEQDMAFRVNADAPGFIAKAAKSANTRLVHISTDYVFSGEDSPPRTESDPTGPKTVYGKSKLSGEQQVAKANDGAVIVRTAWLYGVQGKNFVKTILGLTKKNNKLTVVNDQFGNPTNAEDLAYHLLRLAVSGESGIFHCTNNGVCSWYDFALEIISAAKIDIPVIPCASKDFPRPAARPKYSALDNFRLRSTVGDMMREWRTAIRDYIPGIIKELK